MSTSVERFDEKARREFGKLGHTTVHEGELLRHPVYTRFLHWTVAIFFFLGLLSGLAIYSPWMFNWLTPLFGGGPMARLLHPWFGLLFVIAYLFQFLNWLSRMRWTRADSQPPAIQATLARDDRPVSMNRWAMTSRKMGTVKRWKCVTSRSLR